jgi:hypothetical protein
VLLPPQADLVVVAVAAVGLIGTLAYVIRGGRLFWVVVGGAIYTLVFTVQFILSLSISCKVVRVRSDGAGHLHAERALLIGSKTLDLGGREVTLGTGDAETLIVNETDRPLTLRGEIYSQFRFSATPPPRDLIVPRYSLVPFDNFIDHLGPEDPLPTEVSSKSSTVTQYWLTW